MYHKTKTDMCFFLDLVGIKVDKGTVHCMPIAGPTEGETNTQGCDDLAKRCQKYYAAGAR